MRRRLAVPTLAALLAALAPPAALAAPEKIGATTIEVPAPPGLVRVDDSVPDLLRLSQLFQSATHRLVATYVTPEQIAAAKAGDLEGSWPRYCMLQSIVALETVDATRANFHELRDAMQAGLVDQAAKVEAQMQAQMLAISEGVSQEMDTDVELQISDVRFLAPHDRGDAHLGWSSYMAANLGTGAQNKGISKKGSLTSYIVHVGARVPMLHCYDTEENLEATREMAKAWAQAILAAN